MWLHRKTNVPGLVLILVVLAKKRSLMEDAPQSERMERFVATIGPSDQEAHLPEALRSPPLRLFARQVHRQRDKFGHKHDNLGVGLLSGKCSDCHMKTRAIESLLTRCNILTRRVARCVEFAPPTHWRTEQKIGLSFNKAEPRMVT